MNNNFVESSIEHIYIEIEGIIIVSIEREIHK